MISAASSPPLHNCWNETIESIIRRCLDNNYSLLARRPSGWTEADRGSRPAVLSRTVSSISDSLCQTSFGIAFPEFVRCVVRPTGGNFHTRMHNSNGKHIISSLLIASLGQCVPLDSAYRGIYQCKVTEKFFSVEMTTHTKGHSHIQIQH